VPLGREAEGIDMNFLQNGWDWFWLLVWSFAYIAYLFVLFYIIFDLFRDRSLNGWWKAVWVIFLVFVPFVTGIVYLIARGRGMAERSERKQVEYHEYSDEYVRSVSFASPTDEIAKAKALRDQGIITDGEFEALKNKALGGKY
jgi:Short C-terminal domain/Phospholipase_D-nuclease N-terminal